MAENHYKRVMGQITPSAALVRRVKAASRARLYSPRHNPQRAFACGLAAALVLTLGVSALAAAQGGLKLNTAKVVEDGQYAARNFDTGALAQYSLEFSRFSEVAGYFIIPIGNEYTREAGPGALQYYPDTETARILCGFDLAACRAEAEIWVPLAPDYLWSVAYADYHAAPEDMRFIYEDSDSGITARAVISNPAPEWVMDLRFVYGGVYYIFKVGGSEGGVSPREAAALLTGAF
ncbi:MAG: hypothetical protein LBI44_00240 [Oscillospiraceae bacterium]|jgi:hypothetical protein|nr:hypothetical protein [Oscillospiraceae bacterium]